MNFKPFNNFPRKAPILAKEPILFLSIYNLYVSSDFIFSVSNDSFQELKKKVPSLISILFNFLSGSTISLLSLILFNNWLRIEFKFVSIEFSSPDKIFLILSSSAFSSNIPSELSSSHFSEFFSFSSEFYFYLFQMKLSSSSFCKMFYLFLVILSLFPSFFEKLRLWLLLKRYLFLILRYLGFLYQ